MSSPTSPSWAVLAAWLRTRYSTVELNAGHVIVIDGDYDLSMTPRNLGTESEVARMYQAAQEAQAVR